MSANAFGTANAAAAATGVWRISCLLLTARPSSMEELIKHVDVVYGWKMRNGGNWEENGYGWILTVKMGLLYDAPSPRLWAEKEKDLSGH